MKTAATRFDLKNDPEASHKFIKIRKTTKVLVLTTTAKISSETS